MPALVHPRLLPRRLRVAADPWRADAPRRVGWAIAAALAARTDTLRRLGPFDPGAFLFFEDMELCLRAAAAGVPTELHPEIACATRAGTARGPAYARRAARPARAEAPGGRRHAPRPRARSRSTTSRRASRSRRGRSSHRGRAASVAQLRALIHARRTPVTFM